KDTNSLNSQNVVVQNSTNIAGDYALSDFDARHRYVLNAIWELPFKGNRLVEGWQVSVISQGQSGNPLTVVTNINNFTGNPNLRPDLIGDLRIVGPAGSVVREHGLRPEDRRLLHANIGLRPARLTHRRLPLRQPGPRRDHRAVVLQHRPLADQE